MRNKLVTIYVILLIALICVLFSIRFVGENMASKQGENLNTVYNQATEFLNSFYDQDIDGTYIQLEKRDELLAAYNGYTSKEKWEETVKKDLEGQTLNKISKPSSSSDVHYILHSDEPKETYLVKFSLDVNYKGEKRKRTGELEYIMTDNGFKIHRFEIDILWDPEHGRWVLY